MPKQLTEQDASFLYLETAETPEHVGGLNLVQLPAGYSGDFFTDYRAIIRARMHLIPFLHSKLATLPLEVDRPYWVEDDEIDLDYHIRRETLPRPGTMGELEALVGRLHSGLLDRTRPLWEFYVIDGLASGQLALYTKIHHAAMDGTSSQALVCTMYDPTPQPRVFPPPRHEPAHSHADLPSLVEGVVAHFLRQEIRAAQVVPELIKTWTELVLPNIETLRYEPLPELPATPHTLFNVGITNQRVYAARSLPLAAIKQLAKQSGTKINDVVLSLCSGALQRYLLEKGALPARSLTASVPIAMRETADEHTPNQNGIFLCSLATHVRDPRERLASIHRSALEQKRRFERLKHVALPDLTPPGVAMLMRPLVELYGHSKASEHLLWFGNLTISNVPGPAIPLYIAGAEVVSLYPCSIPFHGAALNITVQSYNGRLDVGLIACRRAVPDLDHLADLLLESLAELQAAFVQEPQTSAGSSAHAERTQS